MSRRIILASASPRRYELLKHISGDFEVIVPECEEAGDGPDAEELVRLNASRKAEAVYAGHEDAVVIGADTVVVLDGRILGKPSDLSEAGSFIRMLSGRTHTVMTGVCVIADGERHVFCEKTDVTFAQLSDAEIEDYLGSESVLDKAGAYALQGVMARHITRVEGCCNNVIGLPVARLYAELRNSGLI